jgi:hypothetical protein
VAKGSFASFLRTLPLLPPGTPVVDYRGAPLYEGGHHPNIAAVVDLDVGRADLQQCADSILRLDAEWRYGRGERNLSYKAASGAALPYARYLAGDRAVTNGKGIELARRAAPRSDDHEAFRSYLDDVFAWANTASLERDAARVAPSDLRGGDFFVMSGTPFGHAVLVLDVARDASGRRALLLGQGYMPAQSFHVLRSAETETWFVLDSDATEIKTPFWAPFPMRALHRLADAAAAPAKNSCLTEWYDVEGVNLESARAMFRPPYRTGAIRPVTDPDEDPGRVRVEALFDATYGDTPAKVEASLVPVKLGPNWLRVHRKIAAPLRKVAARLDPDAPLLRKSGGTFVWRAIAGTSSRSTHSWGIAIDLDPSMSEYWRNDSREAPRWKNRVPQAVVDAFEAEGFIWGGRWYHYDTMHFEYRPELLSERCRAGA